MNVPRVLVLAESCNPQWPSLPIVGYKFALALARACDEQIVTHVRNRENIEKAGVLLDRFHYIDNEYVARPLFRLASWLRGNPEVAWSTSTILSYLPYVEFERQALKRFRPALDRGDFDIVHRITPMSPTLPSYIAGRTRQPFVIGPLNGNLDWPAAFRAEQVRERERLRKLRNFYKVLPYARRTYRRAAAVLAAFAHTERDLQSADPRRIVQVPEIGLDPDIFHDQGRRPALSDPGSVRFLYVGRLVPYKLPEAAIRAFTGSEILARHRLSIVGDGPERPRIEAIVAELGARDRIVFEGRKSQAEVADIMRASDVFVFPSIRELGAGVVIEAMACGTLCIVTDYGAPGALADKGRGVAVPLTPLDDLVRGFRHAMEQAVTDPVRHAEMVRKGKLYATDLYTWDRKAAFTDALYKRILAGDTDLRDDTYL